MSNIQNFDNFDNYGQDTDDADDNRHATTSWRKEQWHLKKEINIGHLFSTISIIVALIVWGISVEKRLTVNEERIVSIIHEVEKNDRKTAETLNEIKSAVIRIEERLSRR